MPSTPSTIGRRLALAGAAGGVVVLAGCSAVAPEGSPTGTQATPLSPIVAGQGYCTAQSSTSNWRRATTARETPRESCATFDEEETGAGRLLVAVAVPDGVADPVPVFEKQPDVSFTVEPEAASDLSAPPAGHHWVGYRSGTVSYEPGQQDPGDVVRLSYPAPRTGEELSAAEQDVRIAIGVQVSEDGAGGSYDPDRPVDCGEEIASTSGSRNDAVSTIACPQTDDILSTPIDPTDARVTAGADVTDVRPGTVATVPFAVEQVGTAPAPADLALRATTDLPGAAATPSVASLPWAAPSTDQPPVDGDPGTWMRRGDPGPADETRPTEDKDAPTDTPVDSAPTRPITRSAVPVAVTVPAGTASGTYVVTLVAADEGGTRSATARVRVTAPSAAPVPAAPAPAAPAPATPAAPATPIARPDRARLTPAVRVVRNATVSRRTRRLHLGRVTCVRTKGTCSVRTTVRIGNRTIGRLSLKVAARSSAGVTLRLTRANLRRLVAKPAVATTKVTAAGLDPVVRTTGVAAKKQRP